MAYAKAIKLNPTHARAYQDYAHLHAKLGRFDESVVAAQRAKQLDPWSRGARLSLGLSFYHAHRYEEAVKEFEGLLKLDENHGMGWDSLGWCYEATGRLDEAVAAWEKAQQVWGWPPAKSADLVQDYRTGGMRGYHFRTG